MSGVLDGQAVDQAITNAAFLYKNANDSSTGVYTLSAPTSGPAIADIQNTINVIVNGVGGDQSTPATAYSNVPSNTVAAGDTHVTAIAKLARKYYHLSASGGHTHSGVDGDGPLVAAVQSIAATGMAAVTGAVIIAPAGNFITIGESGQAITIGFGNYGLSDALTVNNSATAGINFNGGAITGLSYVDWVEAGFPGTPATAHLYMAASSDGHFYKKDSSGTVTVIDGILSLAASGQTALWGNVTLSAGSNVSLTQTGQNIQITSTTGAGGTLTAKFTLSGETIPFVCIDGAHYQQGTQSLTAIYISMLNSGTSGSTVVQLNQYRSGSLQATATASLNASSGNPSGANANLSGTLSLLAGDIITVDVNSIAGGAPSELTVEY